jgi:hypothetical protein
MRFPGDDQLAAAAATITLGDPRLVRDVVGVVAGQVDRRPLVGVALGAAVGAIVGEVAPGDGDRFAAVRPAERDRQRIARPVQAGAPLVPLLADLVALDLAAPGFDRRSRGDFLVGLGAQQLEPLALGEPS